MNADGKRKGTLWITLGLLLIAAALLSTENHSLSEWFKRAYGDE